MFVRSPRFWLPAAYSLYCNCASKVQREAELLFREALGSSSLERKTNRAAKTAQVTTKS